MPATCNNNISVDDIEDLLKNGEHADDLRQGNKSVVKHIRTRKKAEFSDVTDESDKPKVDSFIPENFKVYVKTWGCTHNSSDSEYMAGLLATNGYVITNNKLAADVWLLNSCTVKTPAEDHFKNEISSARSLGKYLVVSGCVPQGAPNTGFLQGLSMIGVQQIDRVVEVVEETLKGNTVRFLHEKKDHGKKTGGASLLLPKIRKNPLIEIIPINTGCLNNCTYCKTKHARGQLGSYPIEEIVARAKQAFEEGVCELWLTSEDTGAYGRDIGVSLPELLWEVVDVIPEGCMLRLGMTNPPYILEHMQAMAAVLSHPQVYSFLHIPVQSGCDGVLGEMKREYTRAEFCTLVDFLVEQVKGITIATDIICGFPTETEKDFEESLTLVEKYKFPSLFINQFYPRPGTPAAKMPRLSTQETKRRSRLMSELFSTFYPYEGREGNLYSVLFTEVSRDGKFCVGHNKYYEQIVVPYDESLMGKRVSVEVKSTSKHCMVGEVAIGEIAQRCSLAAPLQQGQPSSNVNNVPKPTVLQTIDIDDRPYRLPDDNTLLLMVIAAFALVLILRLYQHLSRNWSHYLLYLESFYSS